MAAPFRVPFFSRLMLFMHPVVRRPFLVAVALCVLAVRLRWSLAGWCPLVGSFLAFFVGGMYPIAIIASV